MSESSQLGGPDPVQLTAGATVLAGEVWQLPDGRVGGKQGGAAASGARVSFSALNPRAVPKTTGIVLLDGGRVYWDHSANAATYKAVEDRDCYMGRCIGGAAAADTTCSVAFNVDPPYDRVVCGRQGSDPFTPAIVGTQALGGLGLYNWGGLRFKLDATNEAQKVDALGDDGFAVGANAIIEGAFRIINGSSGSAPDISIGLANATHATDADSITEHLLLHMDGNSTTIKAQSKDGTTTVAAVTTATVYTAGATVACRVEFWIDTRDPANVLIYLNGVRVCTSTTFRLDHATGPLKLLVHVEKTSAADTAEIAVDWLRARLSEQ